MSQDQRRARADDRAHPHDDRMVRRDGWVDLRDRRALSRDGCASWRAECDRWPMGRGDDCGGRRRGAVGRNGSDDDGGADHDRRVVRSALSTFAAVPERRRLDAFAGGHVAITAPPVGQRLRLHTSRANWRSSIDLAYFQLRAAGMRRLRAVGETHLARLMPCSDDSKAGSQIDRSRSIAADALICRHDGRPSGTITRRSLHGGLTRR